MRELQIRLPFLFNGPLFTVHGLKGFVSIRPVFFKNEPNRDSFFGNSLAFVSTLADLSLALVDLLCSGNLGNGFSAGSGFNRGSGFSPGGDDGKGVLEPVAAAFISAGIASGSGLPFLDSEASRL